MSRIFVLDERGNYINQLTQWDLNREIIIKDFEYNTSPVFHFCNRSSVEAIVVNSELSNNEITAKIPNVLLESTSTILVYVCLCDSEKNIVATVDYFELPIRKRAKPKDYVYVQNTDYIRISDLKNKLQAVIDDSEKTLDSISSEFNTFTSNASQVIYNANEAITNANSAAQSAIEIKNTIENALNNGDFNSTTDYLQLENLPSINGIELNGNISLTALKAQQALNGGRLKDIIVVRSLEEYDNLFGNEEYVANLTESLQDGEYILFCLLGAELDDGRIETMISTIVKENDELVFYDGFSTDAIREEIREAVRPIEKELEAIKPKIDNKLDRVFELKHNCEYRRPEPELFTSTWLQLNLPSAIPDDYISSLVFNSGNEPTTLSYPQTILFTGDDCIDNVFVPKANTTYNVMFWYDGINVNAVSRGVPYAQA